MANWKWCWTKFWAINAPIEFESIWSGIKTTWPIFSGSLNCGEIEIGDSFPAFKRLNNIEGIRMSWEPLII